MCHWAGLTHNADKSISYFPFFLSLIVLHKQTYETFSSFRLLPRCKEERFGQQQLVTDCDGKLLSKYATIIWIDKEDSCTLTFSFPLYWVAYTLYTTFSALLIHSSSHPFCQKYLSLSPEWRTMANISKTLTCHKWSSSALWHFKGWAIFWNATYNKFDAKQREQSLLNW